jgi:hypothetical protein
MKIEVYPIPDEAKGVRYVYIAQSPTLKADTTIIPQIDFRVLKSGWLSDYWSWRASQAGADVGACLGMSQKFESEFEKRVQEILLKEVGNQPPRKLQFATKMWKHRLPKFGLHSRIRMP